jgi:hypothetical protein
MWTVNCSRKLIAFALCLGLSAGLLSLASPAAASKDYVPDSGESLVCAICHSCDFPTKSNLCLKKSFCMRNMVDEQSAGLPSRSVMVLDDMEKVYEPVYFNHDKHAQMSEMGGGCEDCHHFIPPTSGHPACEECHRPEGLKGKIQPGLKAAYHQQCLNCHSAWDTDVHCEFCHRKKVGGMSDTELAALPSIKKQQALHVKDLIVFQTNYKEGGLVPFHHRNHVDKYNRDCSICHKDETCASCHVHGDESHPLGLISDIDLHETCYQCHDKEKGCDECHGRNPNDLFDHASTGWALQPYHAVLQCSDCHLAPGKYSANDPRCVTCHFNSWDNGHFNHAVTGVVLDEVHADASCADCHDHGIGSHTSCGECHDDERVWERRASFGPNVN